MADDLPTSQPSDRLLVVKRGLTIPLDEFEWRFSGSGGPGGQHANTANTRVECSYSIAESPSLSAWQRERLLRTFGPVLRIVVADERSQYRNRELAMERMRLRLIEALTERRPRVSTKPTRSSKERRLRDKKARATTKQLRRTADDT